MKGGRGLYYSQTERVGTQALPAAAEEDGSTLEEVELETKGRSNDVELETTAVPLKATVSFPTVKLPLRTSDAEAIGGAADERYEGRPARPEERDGSTLRTSEGSACADGLGAAVMMDSSATEDTKDVEGAPIVTVSPARV
jgi:hypothetical protein